MNTPKVITDTVKATANLSNQKTGLINIASIIGGVIAGGFINKGVSKIEKLAQYKVYFDAFVLAASSGAQFLPAKYLPSWAKQMSLGLGCYSFLAILTSIANSEKTPEAVRTFLTGYIPTIQSGTSLSGYGGTIGDLWNNETANAATETASIQAGAPSHAIAPNSASTLNGPGRNRTMILN